MLKEIMNAFVGSATSTAYSMPSGSGVNVPLQATFKKFFTTFMGTLNNPASNNNYSGNLLAGGGRGQFPGMQGFPGAGLPGQFQGMQGFPEQFPLNQFPTSMLQNQTTKNLKSQAFAPGSVLIDSTQSGTINPLQGFATGQANVPGLFPGGASPLGAAGQFSSLPAFQQGLGGSKLPLLIMPFIGLVGLIKSLLSFRGLAGSLRPERVNKENLSYNGYQNYLSQAYDEGSFEEPSPYEQRTGAQNNFNYSDNQQGF